MVLISISEKRLRIYLHILKQLIMEWMHRQYVVLLMSQSVESVQQHLERIQNFADYNGCTFWDALCNASQIPDIGRSLNKIENFVTLILGFKAKQEYMSIQGTY